MSAALRELERIALWMAHSRRCAYCGEPVQLRDLEIDHIVPESLRESPEELSRLRTELGLEPEFVVHSLNNLLPTHHGCNSRKADRVFRQSRLGYFLELAAPKVDAVRRLIPGLQLQASKERLLGAVQAGLASGYLDFSELIEAASKSTGFPLLTSVEFENGEWGPRTDQKQVESLLDSPVTIGTTPKPDGVQFVSSSGSSISVRTCREYRAAVAAGFYPSDNAQLKMAFFLMMASAVLEAASRARVAAVSYIQSPHAGVVDLDLLPAYLLPRVNPEKEGASLQNMLYSKQLTIISVSSRDLTVQAGDWGTMLREILRADFDGDGIEEILVERTVFAIAGSFRSCGIGLLHRSEPDGRFAFEDWAANVDWARAQETTHLARILR